MSEISHFESRSGIVECSAAEVYTFVTDIRNFEQFIPGGTISNWKADRDSCSFSVSMLGTVSFRLGQKEMYSKVTFEGDALKKNDFTLALNITDAGKNPAGVKIFLDADLNPMLKMMAVKPIAQFLELLIDSMEKFKGWGEIKV
jgi:carbon monoxide dehydrogenase subunit G